MTPREYLETVVRPNVSEFHDNHADLRLAHNAVASVDALAAHIYVWVKFNGPPAVTPFSDDTAYRAALCKRSGEFSLLRDIAKALKHVQLTRGAPQVTRSDQIVTHRPAYGEGDYGMGHYGGAQQVIVNLGLIHFAYLETTVDCALAFLEHEMGEVGCG
jgi:hypothetical protein